MRNFFKTSLYLAAFAFAGILFQISCSNSDDTTPTNTGKLLFIKGHGMSQTMWTSDLDGSNQVEVPLVLPSGVRLYNFYAGNEHSTLKFSPDGQKIFFTATLGAATNYLYSCNLDGSGLQQIATASSEGLFLGDVN